MMTRGVLGCPEKQLQHNIQNNPEAMDLRLKQHAGTLQKVGTLAKPIECRGWGRSNQPTKLLEIVLFIAAAEGLSIFSLVRHRVS
jgi:hypothetical protein